MASTTATRTRITTDGNDAAVRVAYKLSEVVAIYPITPSTPMGEQADAWGAAGQPNLWGTVPQVQEMQSEAGAAGAIHGALQTGALTTTFTASQGLLLMIPNMYKIAGELTPAVFHVASRAIAAQGLSIFGDHQDVMAARATGWAMLCSGSVQEAHDLALIAHAATLKSRVPFIHFFDGFRTSHEINTIELLEDDDLRALVDPEWILAHRGRGLSPERPFIRGTAQNPDVYFQARESVNPFYDELPEIVQGLMDQLAARTGRRYRLAEYHGAPDAERVIVIMGSGGETVEETVRYLCARGEKVGVLRVRLFRPFPMEQVLQALPATVKAIAVLDRTKEPGSAGEPLYLDVLAALTRHPAAGIRYPGAGNGQRNAGAIPPTAGCRVIAGRYGLASKEFTPAMVQAVFGELAKAAPKQRFTVGVEDDVTFLSLPVDPAFSIEGEETARCIFWGLGSDGTVGANKDSIKIIGDLSGEFAQGYFVYDSKKSGSVTISHLRFGPHPIRAPYLITDASFVACHQFSFLERLDVLRHARPGATFLLNSPYGPEEVCARIPYEVREELRAKQLRFYVVDASRVARENGMGGYINRIMQTCFFALGSGLPRAVAIDQIKASIKKAYAEYGPGTVERNLKAVDDTLANLYQVTVPDERHPALAAASDLRRRPPVSPDAPLLVREVLGAMVAGEGDALPVSALPVDGTYPSGTAQWEKRNIALEIPVWDPELCIQCGKCTIVCPHSAIREKVYDRTLLAEAPESFPSTDAKFKEFPGMLYTLQVAPEDCTGCALCFEACPVKDKREVRRRAINMEPQPPIRRRESEHWEFFRALPDPERERVHHTTVKNAALLQPLFEFSGACSGCGETPYIRLVTQLFGDRMVVANATGCSSIYGGNLPTTPWSCNPQGRGPAWSNSLFEDNAEFGMGMRMAIDQQAEAAEQLLPAFRDLVGSTLVASILGAAQHDEPAIDAQRRRVKDLKRRLTALLEDAEALDRLAQDGIRFPEAEVRTMLSLADALVRRSVWIIGGDGWAYDIGFGGLDHVLASGRNVNVLVLDTEVYSNTGGQASKATPRAAVAKFASKGKHLPKKDLGMLAMAYGNVYVARIAMGASDQQTLKAILEAESYDGPSLIIAYSHCIAHGIDMRKGMEQQKLAVHSGVWPLYRYDPRLAEQGKSPLIIDSPDATVPVEQYAYNETRYRVLRQMDEQAAETLMRQAKSDAAGRWDLYEQVARLHVRPVEPDYQPHGHGHGAAHGNTPLALPVLQNVNGVAGNR